MDGCGQAEEPSDSDEEDDFVYNPLKLPLGWDGKPIPYWLYKLHGLNQVLPFNVPSFGTSCFDQWSALHLGSHASSHPHITRAPCYQFVRGLPHSGLFS